MSREYQIKAAFLYNFSKFVEWPPEKFRGAEDPIVIGVLGHPALVEELARITRDRAVNGRGVVVREVASAEHISGLHVLFATAAEAERLRARRAMLSRDSVLTVGETPAFARDEGIIGFVVENDKIRFEISVASAERAGLRVSAHLQKLARAVYTGS